MKEFLTRVSSWPDKIARSLILEILSMAGFLAVIVRAIWG